MPVLAQVLDRLDQALAHTRQRQLLDSARLVVVDNGPGAGWREPLRKLLGSTRLAAGSEQFERRVRDVCSFTSAQ